MTAKDVLKDPLVVSSVAWSAVKNLLGTTVSAWEPDTIRIELERKGIPVNENLATKIFGAMTISITNVWTFDHDVLFAFAIACSGSPAAGEALHYPTPEQLCWAIHEINALTNKQITDEEGFDPDTIDPAIAVVLHDEGYVIAPEELKFVQDCLNHLNHHGHELDIPWKDFNHLNVKDLHSRLAQLDETPQNIQLKRLGDCKLYVAEQELLRARQHVALRQQ